MTINIIKQPDVNVTESELRQYRADYERDHMFYAGTPPTLEEYIRRKQGAKTKPCPNEGRLCLCPGTCKEPIGHERKKTSYTKEKDNGS